MPEKCYIITGHSAIEEYISDDHFVECQTCGRYKVSGTLAASEAIWDRIAGRRHILAAIARQRSDDGNPIFLHEDNVEEILDSVGGPETPMNKLDTLLQYVAKKSGRPGATVHLDNAKDYTVAFAHDKAEFSWLLETANKLGYFGGSANSWYPTGAVAELTLRGWQLIDELRRTGRDSNQAFVAMSFKKDDPTLMDAWREGIKPALKEDTGWEPIRMDVLQHNERIDDRMIAEIRRSGLLVADLTGHRQNVYFEAGFAMGLGIPVIYTCRESDAQSVHFDTRQYKYISWTEPTDLRQKLRERIEATGLAKTLRENVSEN